MNEPKKLPLKWINILFVTLAPILGIVLTAWHLSTEGFSWAIFLFSVLFYYLTGIGITAGYHRLISHRAYDCNNFMKFMFLLFGAGAFQNSALKWCTDHRRHHTKVDTDEDPYSIKRGFFYAHMEWIFYQEEEIYKNKYPADLKNDPLIMWQHKYYFIIAVLVGLALPAWIGYMLNYPIGGIAMIGFLRIAFTQNCTFFVNSLCHMIGKQSYTDENSARDNFILSFFTYGEGFHNYHHCFQSDYRNGILWYNWDPTKWLIKLMSMFKVAWNLRQTPDIEIMRARLMMDEKRIKHYFTDRPFYHNLAERFYETKHRLETVVEQIHQLKKEYTRLKSEFQLKKQASVQSTMNEISRKMDVLKHEFNIYYRQWSYYRKSFA